MCFRRAGAARLPPFFSWEGLAVSAMFATFAVPNKITPKYESLTAA